jgi:rare lipoprotein A
LLGFEQQGTAKVRVQVLADESKAIADAMRHYGTAPSEQVASNLAPPMQSAARVPVTSEALEEPSPESAHIQPVQTTPAVHQQLLETTPVQEVVQLPVTGAHQIYVQAGAFTKLENATRMQQTLSNLGSPVKVTDAVVNGVKFYRVRVGPIPDVTHADATLSQVKQAGVANARTIID